MTFCKSKNAPDLSDEKRSRLAGYASAAVAAGVSILALGQCSQAEIVYTPANISVPVNGGLIFLDLNNDGIADIDFDNGYFVEVPAGTFGRAIYVRPTHPQNRVGAVQSQGHLCAAALGYGVKVGGKSPFQSRASRLDMAFSSNSGGTSFRRFGPWLGNKQGYLGVRFDISGEVHYGWVQVRVQDFVRYGLDEVTILGYAYETIPNKPIESGKTSGSGNINSVAPTLPATLGLLAAGAPAMSVWRK